MTETKFENQAASPPAEVSTEPTPAVDTQPKTPPTVETSPQLNSEGSPPVTNNDSANEVASPQTPPATRESAPPQRSGPVDPRVVALRGMFPDFDDTLLQSVLESVGGEQDRAIDALLGMSDPDYQSEPQAAPMTQTELDEQLARRMLMEDEQQHASWIAQQQQQQRPMYQQRESSSSTTSDPMAEIGEQLSKFAETGKKSLGMFFNKVKSKMQELDPGRQAQNSGYPAGPAGGVGGDVYPYRPGEEPYTVPGGNQPPPIAARYDSDFQSIRMPNEMGYDATPKHENNSISSGTADAASARSVDGGKIGLLPKRPVSLQQTQSAPTNNHTDDDDLEYTENPFEDGKK